MCMLKSVAECSSIASKPTAAPVANACLLLFFRAKSSSGPRTDFQAPNTPQYTSTHADATSAVPATPQSASVFK